MSDDADDDYMGDLSRFLQPHELQPPVATSVKQPSFASLGLSKQQRKKLKVEQQLKEEDHNRLEGLASAINSSNKGFKMLQQMGYKPGLALGKHGQGSIEPLNLDVKRSRSGLGRDHVEKAQEQVKAKRAEFKRDMERKKQAELKSTFQERKKTSWKGRKIVRDYRKAQTALRNLEEASGELSVGNKKPVSEHTESEIMSNDQKEEGADEEDESEEEIELQDLLDLLQRLRSEYFYCLYCGFQYDTADALLANCPGMEEENH